MDLHGRRNKRRNLILIIFSTIFLMSLSAFLVSNWFNVASSLATLVQPLQKSVHWLRIETHHLFEGHAKRGSIADENSRLQSKMILLEKELSEMESIQGENERLRALLKFSETHHAHFMTARVIGADPDAQFMSLMIDKGRLDGVTMQMSAAASHGLVGRIGKLYNNQAIVLLISDPNYVADVMIQRTRQRAVLVGGGKKIHLGHGLYLSRLEYLSQDSDIQVGDIVITSGLDGVHRRELPIGSIGKITADDHGIFKEADVLPFEDLHRLEEILLYKNL